MSLELLVVEIDDDVQGEAWTVKDLNVLSKIIAVITLGQAQHAARIIAQLEPLAPALSHADLFAGARGQLRIKGDTESKRDVSRHHRDGFLFECISWIVARNQNLMGAYLKDPHISATSQGLDGLMIQINEAGTGIKSATIFEDKCTNSPRDKFRDEVMPTFTAHHENRRSRELVANAVSLLKESGLDATAATRAAAAILSKEFRNYRAALTVGNGYKTAGKRKDLFKGYNLLGGITKSQRIGAVFIFDGDLRDWFEKLASGATLKLHDFQAGGIDV